MRVLGWLSGTLFPALFWLLIMLSFDSVELTVMTLFAALLHELGHIFVGILIGCEGTPLPKAVLTGLRLSPGRLLSYREEALLAAGGPIFSLLAFLILIPFSSANAYVLTFALINLLTAASNLLPIRSYDGYRILYGLFCHVSSLVVCERIMSTVSLIFSAVAALLSLIILYKTGEGYWFFTIFFSVLLKEVFKKQK